MPVFDVSNTPDAKNEALCTYTTFQSDNPAPSPEQPILVLDNRKNAWAHHSIGVFTNPVYDRAPAGQQRAGGEDGGGRGERIRR